MVRDRYIAHPEEAIQRIEIPGVLKQLCFGLERNNAPREPNLEEIPDWCPDFFRAILLKIEKDEGIKRKMLPQVAQVLCNAGPCVFRPDLADRLLGGSSALFALVLQGEAPDPETQPYLFAVFQEALAASNSPNPEVPS
jgi:hypothetical protein